MSLVINKQLRSECPIAASLDIFGDRWTLLILRDMLLDGRTHYSEFAVNESIATNILADRLSRLVDLGLIAKIPDPQDGRRVIYIPLEPAIELTPILAEIAAWGLSNTDVPLSPHVAPLRNEKSRRSVVKARVKAARAQLGS